MCGRGGLFLPNGPEHSTQIDLQNTVLGHVLQGPDDPVCRLDLNRFEGHEDIVERVYHAGDDGVHPLGPLTLVGDRLFVLVTINGVLELAQNEVDDALLGAPRAALRLNVERQGTPTLLPCSQNPPCTPCFWSAIL